MFRRSPRAALLWAASAIVAIVTAATVVSMVSSLRHQDETFGRLHTVVVTRHDLPVGTRLTDSDLTVSKLRGEAPATDTVRVTASAVGRVVRVPMLRGALVTTRHLSATRRSGLGDVVPNGQRAVRLVIEHGLRPTAGDLVDVYATFDPQTLGDNLDPTVLVAPAVMVIAVDPTGDSTGDSTGTGTGAAGDTVGITVLVSPHQASRLAFSTASGTLSLALAPPEAATSRG